MAVFGRALDTSADGMMVIGNHFNTLRSNTTSLELAGIDHKGITGHKCYEVFKGESCHTEKCPMIRIQNSETRIKYDGIKICQDSCGPC